MIHQAQPWLPPDADGAFERQLAAFAEGWAAQWICAAPTFAVVRAERRCDRAQSWHGGGEVAVGIAADDLLALGQAALAGHADTDNSRDREIAVDVGRQAIADLASRVCASASPADACVELAEASTGEQAACFRLSGAGWALALSLGDGAQVRLRKHLAGSARRPVLGKLAAAVAPESVALGCHLGAASLSAAEVSALSPGDLIVLDRLITDELPLTVERTAASRGKASIQSAAGAHSIRVTQTIDLTAGSN